MSWESEHELKRWKNRCSEVMLRLCLCRALPTPRLLDVQMRKGGLDVLMQSKAWERVLRV